MGCDFMLTWEVKKSLILLKWSVLKMLSDYPALFPPIFFDRCVPRMIVLLRCVVPLGEAMYQSAFLSLEF